MVGEKEKREIEILRDEIKEDIKKLEVMQTQNPKQIW